MMLHGILTRNFLICCAVIESLAAGVGAAFAEYTSAISESDVSPKGDVRVTQPEISWGFVTTDGTSVRQVNLLLNGKPVTVAASSDSKSAVRYIPEAPLPPGHYLVHCAVTFSDETTIPRDWEFRVVPDAVDSLQKPTDAQLAACNRINEIRRSVNLPLATIDERLCAAAASHSAYVTINHAGLCHDEKPGLAGFVGEQAVDRGHAYGFSGTLSEDVSSRYAGADAVNRLFDGPYHRRSFLQPGAIKIGAGASTDFVDLLFGDSDESRVVCYPADGQTGVPVGWNCDEEPNPLRNHPAASKVTGYVISLFRFAPESSGLKAVKAVLTTADGKPVDTYINTPADDDQLANGVLIIPMRPLQPMTSYHVAIVAVADNGDDCSQSWSFTTGPTPKAGLHP